MNNIHRLAASVHELNVLAVQQYMPVVEAILQSQSCDAEHIEHTLDDLLSFCGYEPTLSLYKKLCRHYYKINPAATVAYVYAYRDLWDSATEIEP
jgi:hypothetical protein